MLPKTFEQSYHVPLCVRVNDHGHAFPPSCDRENDGDYDRHDPWHAREIRGPFHGRDCRGRDPLQWDKPSE